MEFFQKTNNAHKPDAYNNESMILSMAAFLCELYGCIEIHENIDKIKNNSKYHLYLKFCEAVENNFTTLHKVQDYTKLLDVSVRHLSDCTKSCENITPLKLINKRLLIQAKRLLAYSDLNIKEIAFKLGFLDAPHFIKFFRKEIGITPLDYRTPKSDKILRDIDTTH